MVGTARFELATPCTPSKCATRLRYVPMESAAEQDSVGFDFQILHQSAATGEAARSTIKKFLSSAFRIDQPPSDPSVTNGV